MQSGSRYTVLRVLAPAGIALWLVLILSAAALGQQGDLGNIIGEVRVLRVGFPPKPVLVSLQSRGATVNSVYADGQGRFGFYSLPGGVYHIVIQEEEYAAADEQVVLNPLITATMYTQVTLNPKPVKDDKAAGQGVAGNSHVVDTSEFTRKFPKKALKEYEKGMEERGKNNLESAASHLKKALEAAPDFYPAHNELGRVYLAQSSFAAAQKEFEEAIRLNPSYADPHLNLGNIYLLTKDYGAALSSVENGLRTEPNSPYGHFVLGSIYARTGRYQEAERVLRDALRWDPKMSNVHLELVNLYLSQKRKGDAANELRGFLKDFPNDPFAPKARSVLEQLDK